MERLELHQLDTRIAWRPEYKTRERIHPGLADPGLLAIPASWGRLQTSIRTGAGFIRISSALRHCNPLYRPLYYACSPRYQRDMLIWRHPHLPLPWGSSLAWPYRQQTTGVAFVTPLKGTVQTTNWRRPCITCATPSKALRLSPEMQ